MLQGKGIWSNLQTLRLWNFTMASEESFQTIAQRIRDQRRSNASSSLRRLNLGDYDAISEQEEDRVMLQLLSTEEGEAMETFTPVPITWWK
jgi:hypothetical protein